MTAELKVVIVRFVDETQPGVVACEFVDAFSKKHTIIDKVPMFTYEDLWSDSIYPQPGEVLCEVLDRCLDHEGHSTVRITTLESTEGLSEFVVFESQLKAARQS